MKYKVGDVIYIDSKFDTVYVVVGVHGGGGGISGVMAVNQNQNQVSFVVFIPYDRILQPPPEKAKPGVRYRHIKNDSYWIGMEDGSVWHGWSRPYVYAEYEEVG